jgi:hypothetical protein
MLRASVDLREVEGGLEALRRRGLALGDVFRAAKTDMRADQTDHAKSQAGPEGTWPPRAAATIAKGRRGRVMGKAARTISYSATATGVRGESRWPAALAHMLGDRVGRGARLPARVFMWISDTLLDKVTERVNAKVIASFGRR